MPGGCHAQARGANLTSPCEPEIAAAIRGAQHAIRVQAYGFTAPAVLGALAAAHRRGVDVAVILDKINEEHRYSGATYMAHAGMPVWIDDVPRIAHTKAIIIDGRLVIGGSYNYTRSADERNAEDVTFIESEAVAEAFLANWEARREASRAYESPGE